MANATRTDTILNEEKFVTREQWKAKKATMRKPLKTPVPYIVFSYTNSIPCETETDCMDRVLGVQTCQMSGCGMQDIKYNFMIGGDGRVYEGRGWKDAAHKIDTQEKLAPLNNKYIEIAFICKDDEKPTDKMGETAAALIRDGIKKNLIAKDVKVTTIWKTHTIPNAVITIENLRVSRHIVNNYGNK